MTQFYIIAYSNQVPGWLQAACVAVAVFYMLQSALKSRLRLIVPTGVPNVAHSQCMLAMLHSLAACCFLHDHHACKTQLQHCHNARVCSTDHFSLAMSNKLS